MLKNFFIICVTLSCFLISFSSARAVSISSDPQYVVMNFAPMNELNWAAEESEWQHTIKPQILAQIQQLKAALPAGSTDRRLAWSTLQEYMNTPLDEPSEHSY